MAQTSALAVGPARCRQKELRKAVFTHLQYQDRLDQMLGSIDQDMDRFERWLADNREATQADAARWLEELDRTYTMEAQRSHHHGTVAVARSPAVEFF